MTITLELNEQLAERLKEKAESEQLSLENCVAEVLDTALGPGENSWEAVNSRRLTLIAKKYSEGLSPPELEELENLQEASAEMSQPMDNQLLNKLSELEKLAGITNADDQSGSN